MRYVCQSFSFLRRNSLTLFILTLGVACDRPEMGTNRRAELRCPHDGLCWQEVGKRSFEGAYRQGDNEVKFDAIFSPSRSPMTQFKDEWSFRIIDGLGVAFFSAPSSNPPDGWGEGSERHEKLPNNWDEQKEHLRSRYALAQELTHVLLRTDPPSDALRVPWDKLRRHLQSTFLPPQTDDSRPTTDQRQMQANEMSARDPQEARHTVFDDQDTEDIGISDGRSGEPLLDDAEDHVELAGGEWVPAENELLLPIDTATAPQRPTVIGDSLTTFAFGHKKNKGTHPAEYHSSPGMEFRQELDLYWKHTRSFLFFGWKTGKHHTAACIRVYKRLVDSSEPWQFFDRVCTENHGSKAGEDGMMLYAQCRDFPTTQHYFAWKGECGGAFPTHVCNDDTALQIRHAYGEWDDGKKCLKRKRTHRPWCDKPW